MKSRQILIAILILASTWQVAAAQPKKQKNRVEAPALEKVLMVTNDAKIQRCSVRSHRTQARNALGATRCSQIIRNRNEPVG